MGRSARRAELATPLLVALVACADEPAIPSESGGETTEAPADSSSSAADPARGEPEATDGDAPARATGEGEAPGGHSGGGSGGGSDGDEPPPDAGPLPGPPFEDLGILVPHVQVLGSLGPGQAWADVDRDGWLDLLAVGGTAPTVLLHNEGDGTFAPWEVPALDGIVDTIGASFADYDNDGWPDLYIARTTYNVMLHNEGEGVFVDVTEASGTADAVDHHGVGSAWADYDGDGLLDMYLVNEVSQPNVLYHNLGDGVFEAVPAAIRPDGPYQTYAASWLDYDEDGDLDLYVVNDKEVGNELWRNDGPGCGSWCLRDVAPSTGSFAPACGMGLAVADYDEDGDLDLSFSDYLGHMLLRNEHAQGASAFTDVSASAGVVFSETGWGVLFLDVENDGWLDLYLAAHDSHNRLFRNLGDGTFADVSAAAGCDDPGLSFGASYADYDNDGGVDIVVGNRAEGHRLFHNRRVHPQWHWLGVELVGGGPINRDAVGTRVWVTTTSGRVLMQEVVSGSSYASSSMTRLHFGLRGDDVDEVLVRWPNGLYEKPDPPAADQIWVHQYPDGD